MLLSQYRWIILVLWNGWEVAVSNPIYISTTLSIKNWLFENTNIQFIYQHIYLITFLEYGSVYLAKKKSVDDGRLYALKAVNIPRTLEYEEKFRLNDRISEIDLLNNERKVTIHIKIQYFYKHSLIPFKLGYSTGSRSDERDKFKFKTLGNWAALRICSRKMVIPGHGWIFWFLLFLLLNRPFSFFKIIIILFPLLRSFHGFYILII